VALLGPIKINLGIPQKVGIWYLIFYLGFCFVPLLGPIKMNLGMPQKVGIWYLIFNLVFCLIISGSLIF
jgi:hypothetical protein